MQIIITKDSKQYLICKTCETIEPIKTTEQIIQTEKITKPKIEKGTTEKTYEGHDFCCKKCQNNKCKIIDLGMMIGDED